MPTKQQIVQAIRGNPRIPAPPQVVFQILEQTRDANCDINKLAKTISHDGGITAQLLRQANSALYGCTTTTSSVSAACVRLGMKRVRAAVVNQHVVNGLSAARPPSFKPERYWQSAFATSVAARELCVEVAPAQAEDASTAGLLCDMGIGLIAFTLAKPYEELLLKWKRQPETELHAIESADWGVTHAEVGAEILKDWKLDPHIVEAVRQHHMDPLAPSDGEHAKFCRAIAAATALSRIALDGSDMDRVTALFSLMEGLTKNADALVNKLLDNLVSKIQATAQSLEIELGDMAGMEGNFDDMMKSLPDLTAAMESRPAGKATVG